MQCFSFSSSFIYLLLLKRKYAQLIQVRQRKTHHAIILTNARRDEVAAYSIRSSGFYSDVHQSSGSSSDFRFSYDVHTNKGSSINHVILLPQATSWGHSFAPPPLLLRFLKKPNTVKPLYNVFQGTERFKRYREVNVTRR